ncbi:MAG: ATP-binding protein [Planctomycetaceae bacterium]|nr:ATP-binding protein [Planctomycetaceae bacterium]
MMYQTVQKLIDAGVPVAQLWWFRLDHPLLVEQSLGKLVESVIATSNGSAEKPAYLFLDEITYADKWDLWLKTFFDDRWPIRLVGTSSATAAIREQGTESGVGRWEEHFLSPCLFTEYLDLIHADYQNYECRDSLDESIQAAINQFNVQDLSIERRKFLVTGGFPELLINNPGSADETSALLRSQRTLRSDAIEKAIYKDIPQSFGISEPTKLERLLYTLAGQITGIVSPKTIAGDVGVSGVTIEKYISYLERAFIVFQLSNYSASEESIQRRGKRLYFIDGAVRNAALLRGMRPLDSNEEMGHLVENMVASHLFSLAEQSGVRLYHWRHGKQEVDLVYDHPEKPLAFEITLSKKHNRKGIQAFTRKFPRFKNRCYLVGPSLVPQLPADNSPGSLPLDDFLVLVGQQAQSALEQNVRIDEMQDNVEG